MNTTVNVVIVLLAVAIAVVLALAVAKPDTFRVERSISIAAPPEAIFPLINDFHRWAEWSPYEVKDPDQKRTFSGTDAGTGAVYAWDGDKNVGAGRMEIIDTRPPSKIVIKLDFLRPFEGHNTAEFTLQPGNGTTVVIWAIHGPAPLMSKLMQVFLNMDHMIGKDFAIGLANLKSVVER